MKVYQLHLGNVDKVGKSFKTKNEALDYQLELITKIRDYIKSGKLSFKKYIKEAEDLKVVETEISTRRKIYSVAEYDKNATGIMKSFSTEEAALNFLYQVREDSTRNFYLMESFVNDH